MEEALAAPHTRRILAARRDAVAEQWYRAISQTSYVPQGPSKVRARLAELVDEAIDILLTTPVNGRRARDIGETLARMHYVRAEAVEGTLDVLGRQLLLGLSESEVASLQPQLAQLLAELSSGYFQACLDVILREQEEVRNALVTALHSAQRALRQARDQLELRVEQRTAELAQANRDLRDEIAERARVQQALRESEEKFRDLVENISDIIYILDATGTILYSSPAVKYHLGYTSEEIIGHNIAEFMHPDDVSRALKILREAWDGATTQSEYRIMSRSGGVRWMRTSSRPIVVGGEAVGVRGVLADITDRKKMEQELQESEARYRAVVQEQTDLICRFQPDGTFIFVNEAYVRFFGLNEAPSSSRSFLALMSGEKRAVYRALLQSLGPDTPVVSTEQRSIRADGQERWLQWSLRGLFDENGRLAEVQAVGRDITERRRAEEALRESEERWRSLVQNAPDVVATVDRRGDILFLNRTLEGSPLQPEGVVGTNVADRVLPEYRKTIEQALEDVFVLGAQGMHEVAVATTDGRVIWLAIRYGPIMLNGLVTAAMLVVRDMTEWKKLDEMKDNLIRDVSHELRTPLAKVQMSLELLQEIVADEDPDRPRAMRTSEIATRNVRRLLETVEGILDLSRLESGTLGYEYELFAIEDLAKEVMAYMRPLAQAKGLRLQFQGVDQAQFVEGDREKLFRVLLNLVDNAVKFTDEGHVLISVERAEDEVVIAVSDSGIGISADNLSHIFDRFFQARSTARGVGIGLTICKTIVEAHGGRIWATSPGEGQGATFRISLPAEDEP